MNRAFNRVPLIASAFLVSGSLSAKPPDDPDWIARGKSEMVAADSEYASKAGLAMLEAGGNAIDAAVAVSFALAVTRPYSTGLGGGGFMIARFADGLTISQDFRETAPAGAAPAMFLFGNPDAPSPSEFGYLAVAVPGLVAGRCEALEQWGTLPLDTVLQPAIDLARDGYLVDEDYVRTTNAVLETFAKHPSLKSISGYVYKVHLNDGKLRQVGDRLTQPKLARLLEGIASGGADFFYRGPVACDVAAAMKRHAGIITEEDLRNYKPVRNHPYITTYRGYKLILAPLPSAGGIAIAEALNILEHLDLAAVSRTNPALAAHLQIEALKHAFADRSQLSGESMPNVLLSKAHAQRLAEKVNPDQTLALGSYGFPGLASPKDSGTSHFSIFDRHGNSVVSTETINTSFGSLVAIDEWGLILNNEMDDFTSFPERPNSFGLVQSYDNAVKPGARPLSSMSPTIVLKEDEVQLLIGASGGPRIITSVVNVMLKVMDEGKSLEEAMLAVRPHHQFQPDEINFDRAPGNELATALEKRGHKISDKRKTGIVQAIMRDDNGWVGASDPRKGGKPAGR
jgi:gamma-glutamyltranspeptidase / glutathione hydrolase